MATPAWRFDERDPASVWFENDVARFASALKPVLERALIDILEDPFANPRAVVSGNVVYVKRLQSFLAPKAVMPALLLVYSLSRSEGVIRKLALFRVADVAPAGTNSTDEEVYRALERVVETALRRARQHEH